MAVPGYHAFMLPLLTLTGDGQEHSLVEVVETLAEQFELSEQDRSIVLSSGQTRLYNRVAWAITYLAKGLLEKTGRERFRITQRGREVLSQQPAAIDNAFLGQFEEFVAFKHKSNKNDSDLDHMVRSTPEKEVTPDERMEEAYRELREALADDLLTRVDTADGRAERRNALLMLDHARRRHGLAPRVVAADAGYGAGEFLCAWESRGITPHAALPGSKIAGDSGQHRARRRMRRRTRTKGSRVSQRPRRMIEPVIGSCKQTGGLGRTRFLGHERIQNDGLLAAAAWNLLRMTTLRGVT